MTRRRYLPLPEQRAEQRLRLLTNAVVRETASVAKKAADAVTAAVSGDLIEASPELKDRIEQIETRLSELEMP